MKKLSDLDELLDLDEEDVFDETEDAFEGDVFEEEDDYEFEYAGNMPAQALETRPAPEAQPTVLPRTSQTTTQPAVSTTMITSTT